MKTKNEMRFCFEEDGNIPLVDFLRKLDVKMRAKVMSVIWLLNENGYVYPPFVEYTPFGPNMEALNIPTEEGDTVVIPFFVDEWPNNYLEIVLTHGFVRTGAENPKEEIQKAQRLIDEYLDS